jgi:phenylacetate-coenzyme A ligase PaaK-like adenylate-forming protein
LLESKISEIVMTTPQQRATPLLRYCTRDLSRISGRSGDMLIVNGVNLFQPQIGKALMKMPEVGTNYANEVGKAWFHGVIGDQNQASRQAVCEGSANPGRST